MFERCWAPIFIILTFSFVAIMLGISLWHAAYCYKPARFPLFESWTQVLPPELNIKNEKVSKFFYSENPDLKLTKQFIIGWGPPKSLKAKIIIWIIPQRDEKGEAISNTLRFFILKDAGWLGKHWEYLEEEIIQSNTLPPEGRKMFSPDSKFGKRLKGFCIDELKLTEAEFLELIPTLKSIPKR